MNISKEFWELEAQLRNKKAFLVNVPDHNNVWDHLIWFWTEIFLQKIHCTLRWITSRNVLDTDSVSDEDIILLHWGGNFGDLYPEHQILREKTIAQFPKNTIIMFPQTAHFQDDYALQRAINIFSQHTDLTLCARDAKTYAFFCENFIKNTILLVPDMATVLRRKDMYKYIKHSKTDNEVLFLFRTDDEMKKTNFLQFTWDKNVYDWNKFRHTKFLSRIVSQYEKIRDYEKYISPCRKLVHSIAMQYLLKMLQKKYVEKGAKAFERYTTIVTDRLHGALLGLILEKNVILLDNSYGKNKNYYDTWLRDNKNISFVESLSDAVTRVEESKNGRE